MISGAYGAHAYALYGWARGYRDFISADASFAQVFDGLASTSVVASEASSTYSQSSAVASTGNADVLSIASFTQAANGFGGGASILVAATLSHLKSSDQLVSNARLGLLHHSSTGRVVAHSVAGRVVAHI